MQSHGESNNAVTGEPVSWLLTTVLQLQKSGIFVEMPVSTTGAGVVWKEPGTLSSTKGRCTPRMMGTGEKDRETNSSELLLDNLWQFEYQNK